MIIDAGKSISASISSVFSIKDDEKSRFSQSKPDADIGDSYIRDPAKSTPETLC